MRIAMGSDHAGFDQKQQLKDILESWGHEVTDCGPASAERVDYPDFAYKVAAEVALDNADRGILVCGTGIGMALAADKIPGIRAAAIQDVTFAELARQHNDLNVLCLSGRFVDLKTNTQIAQVFLETKFEGGRHALRVAKVMSLDSDTLPIANF